MQGKAAKVCVVAIDPAWEGAMVGGDKQNLPCSVGLWYKHDCLFFGGAGIGP